MVLCLRWVFFIMLYISPGFAQVTNVLPLCRQGNVVTIVYESSYIIVFWAQRSPLPCGACPHGSHRTLLLQTVFTFWIDFGLSVGCGRYCSNVIVYSIVGVICYLIKPRSYYVDRETVSARDRRPGCVFTWVTVPWCYVCYKSILFNCTFPQDLRMSLMFSHRVGGEISWQLFMNHPKVFT